MRNVTFQEVGMENYGPYTDPMILTFENDKLTLITGPNGIGKTMAIDAIPFTLYGTTSKGAKGDDVVNNKIGKNCKTWVKLMVNEDQYLITRYHKYTKYQNTVIVNHNGVDIKQGHREVLPYIERIICPQQAFMNALMFGQKVKDFFTDLVDSKKKEIFRKILDLAMFLIYYKGADEALKEIEEQRHNSSNDMQIKIGLVNDAIEQIELLTQKQNDFYNERENEIKEQQKLIDNIARLLHKWELDLIELNTTDTDLESTIMELATIAKQLSDQKAIDYQEIKDLDNRLSTKASELNTKAQKFMTEVNETHNKILSELQQNKSDIKEGLSHVVAEIKDEKHQHEMDKARYLSACESLKERAKEIQTHVLDADISECPLCEQVVDEHTITTLKGKISNYNDEINVFETDANIIAAAIQELNTRLSDESKKSNHSIRQVEDEERAAKAAKAAEILQIDHKLKTAIDKVIEIAKQEEQHIIQESENTNKELDERKNALNEIRTTQEKNIADQRNAEDNITRLKQEKIQGVKDLKSLEESKYDKTQLNSYLAKEVQYVKEIEAANKKVEKFNMFLEVAQFWKTGFSSAGIPSMLIDEAIPYMNERVEYYLDMLTNGRYIVSFDTLAETKAGDFRDKISVHVLDTQTRANSRVQLSGGQTRIIDIAIILTLGDLLSTIQNVTFNILLFDEIFDSLDEQNIQYVSKVLSKIKLGKAVYVISHQHQDHLESDETLAFT